MVHGRQMPTCVDWIAVNRGLQAAKALCTTAAGDRCHRLTLWSSVVVLYLQDIQLNEMRTMIKVLQEDCKSLASALTQICNAGAEADISSVLQALPPNLVNVSMCWVVLAQGRTAGGSSVYSIDRDHLTAWQHRRC